MIETLLNDVTLEGMRRIRVVSDLDPVPFAVPECSQVRTWSDNALGLHYLEATWACREAILVKCEGWECARSAVLWKLQLGERVSEAFGCAFAIFAELFKCCPDYAFMRKLPKNIEDGFEVADVTFMQAEWVPAGCIVVCEGALWI